MAWYTTGTVTLVKNSNIASGTGTQWLEKVRYGDILLVQNKLYEVTAALNDVQLQLEQVYAGDTIQNQPYALIRNMTNASNYDLILKIDEMLEERSTNLTQFTTWAAGSANGGPNGDGKYPLTNRVGVTSLVYSPAKMASMAGIDQQDAISQVQAQLSTLNTMLADYSDIKTKVETFTGVTLDDLNGQPLNDKLSSIASLTFEGGEMIVSINNQSFAKYPISDRALSFLAATTPKDMRNVIGAGSGGGGGTSGGGGTPGRRVAIIGTSLCQLCDYGTDTELSHTNRSWIGWAGILTNQRLITPIWRDMNLYPGWETGNNVGKPRGFRGLNAGVSSDNAPNILERATYLVNEVECDIVVVDSGINDIGNNSLTDVDIHNLRAQTADYLLANGKIVILLTLLSPAATYYPIGSTQRRKMERVNNLARNWAAGKKNLYLFDWTEPMMDFNDPNGQPKPLHSVDGLHFAPRGAFAVGKGLADLFMTLLPKAERRVWSQEDVYEATLAPYGNLLSNAFCFGSAGTLDAGASGSVANFYRGGINSGDGTASYSKVVKRNGRGQAQRVVVTPGATETQALFRVSDITHNLPEGTWVQASVEIDCEAWDGYKGINLQIRDLATGGLTCHACKVYDGFPNTAEAWSGTIVTPAIQVKAGGQLRWRVEITSMAGATGTGAVEVGACELRPVTDPKLIVNAG
uniref:GDSL-like lipase n=1 Tax=Pseudomonas phage Nican01 TaxID=3138540 RepID=A0AAU6W077_9CAUD